MHRHREPRLQHVGEVFAAQLEQAGAGHRSQVGRVGLVARGGDERPRGAGVRPWLVGRRQHHVGAVQPLDQLDLAVEQDVEGLGRGILAVHVDARVVRLHGAVIDQPVQLLVGEALEQEAASQFAP